MKRILLLAALPLAACTTAQIEKAQTITETACMSAPIAQALYNTAVKSGDATKVNQILDYIRASCPGVLILIQTVPVKEAVPPPPVPGPERG